MLVGVLLTTLACAGACASLDGLAGSPDASSPDAGSPDASDAPFVSESGLFDVDPDVVVNPSAGLTTFALHGTKTEAGTTAYPVLIDPIDGSVRPLGCAYTANDLVDPREDFVIEPTGPFGMRAFYDPLSPDKAKFVFPGLADGGTIFGTNPLLLVDQTSECGKGTPPRDIAFGIPGPKVSVSFSDDGRRAAFLVAENLAPRRLVTVSTEGALDPFELRSFPGSGSTSITTAPPAWVRDAEGLKIIWGELSDTSLLVRIALDRSLNNNPAVLLDCTGAFVDITQIGVFRGLGGKVFIAFTGQVTEADAGAPSVRGIYAVDYSQACSTRALVFSDAPTTVSDDFALSPDGDRMAHASNRDPASDDAGALRRRIWIGSVTARTRTLCSDSPVGFTDQGPQWLAGGAKLTWTRRPKGKAFGGEIMIADVSGQTCSNVRSLVVLASGESVLTPRNGCAVGAHIGSPGDRGALAVFVIGLAASVVNRRRRLGLSRDNPHTRA